MNTDTEPELVTEIPLPTEPQSGVSSYFTTYLKNGLRLVGECHPDLKEYIDTFFGFIRRINIEKTHTTNVSHGSCGQYSRYYLVQHRYAASMTSYIECLEIKKCPDGRCAHVVNFNQGSRTGFAEFSSKKHAIDAWEKCWGKGQRIVSSLKEMKGFVRYVTCGPLTPWFYAVGNEALIGDYAAPYGMEDDPVYRLGTKVIHTDYQGRQSLKTCMGCRIVEESYGSFSYEKKTQRVRTVYFDDGSTWRETSGDSLRPIREDELWVDDAMSQFRDCLTGDSKEFTLRFADDTKFTGRLSGDNTKGHTAKGSYYTEVTFSGGDVQKGRVPFTPSDQYPNVVAEIRGRCKVPKGQTIEKIEVRRQGTSKGKKKWKGCFYDQKA